LGPQTAAAIPSPFINPVSLPPLQNITAIATGGIHTCALTGGGGVKCWGSNWYGQLGDGTTTDRSTPVDVVGLASGVAAIAAGMYHTCALTSGGGAKCWGYNGAGQLGDGTTTQRSTPVDVVGLGSGVAAIAAGGYHTCALVLPQGGLTGGGAKCWGWNRAGQLGDGTLTSRSTPVDVVGLGSGVAAIAAGWEHTCALVLPQGGLTSGGGAKCWGSNWGSTPVDVVGLGSGVVAIAAGVHHTCALTGGGGGGAKCWGDNEYGQLGDGTTTWRSTPVDVVGLTSGVAAIAARGYHTCALTSGGGAKCWGYNEYGQLGDGTTTDRSTPVDVVGLGSGVAAIAAGGFHTCALTSGGGVKCWGWNGYGRLGDGTTTDRNTPVDVVGLASGVAAIAAGGYHTCALVLPQGGLTGGGAKCWGGDLGGQLGLGTILYRTTPVDVVTPLQVCLPLVVR
jgi:alpha-tubulin suppressor-like RCC1 family protein